MRRPPLLTSLSLTVSFTMQSTRPSASGLIIHRLLLAFLLVIALAAPSGAEDGIPPEEVPDKSLLVAYGLAVGGTVLPIMVGAAMADNGSDNAFSGIGGALVVGGYLVGPSLGQFYASSVGHGIAASLVRAAGAGLAIVGVVSSILPNQCSINEDGSRDCDEPEDHDNLIYAGTALYLGGMAYSLYDTFDATHNFRRREARRRLGWAPTLRLDKEGGIRPGAMAFARF